jgi:hypothetical protein
VELIDRIAAPGAAAASSPAHRRAARDAWATLLARLYEVFPLVCPLGGAGMRIIAFITDGPTLRNSLVHLGEPMTPPTVAPARDPPLWDRPPAGQREIDPQAQPAGDCAFDQRVTWQPRPSARSRQPVIT